jgi:Uma2 family endonuclease
MSAQADPFISAEQYLALERAADLRHEYIDGHMYAMAGGPRSHTYLTVAVASELRTALRGRRCSVGSSDLRVQISAQGPYFYPDVVVSCAPPPPDLPPDIASDPLLIVEVLSPSTESFDRGGKFLQYQRIESLRQYVLVSQNAPVIETYARGSESKWIYTSFAGMDATCRLESVDCAIPLASIYNDIQTVP